MVPPRSKKIHSQRYISEEMALSLSLANCCSGITTDSSQSNCCCAVLTWQFEAQKPIKWNSFIYCITASVWKKGWIGSINRCLTIKINW